VRDGLAEDGEAGHAAMFAAPGALQIAIPGNGASMFESDQETEEQPATDAPEPDPPQEGGRRPPPDDPTEDPASNPPDELERYRGG
jgi:hypothetical protein